ncbi:distal membrane-arm assembly complex protein 2 [Caerostris extrusa]|uniref:Distal membrane-arm assembly complex protein 2 n=1 Tax=Caerostris extrusa TaxID=172846 RepID=A0AAV4MZ99_CAEEX|nr:distal membrane-arm assembly complex protein 2 [Caerostris extrusa]
MKRISIKMLKRNLISKSLSCLPFITSRRSVKVRNLPVKYDQFETPYMKTRKPGILFITDFYAFMNKRWTLDDIRYYKKWKLIKEIRDSQKYINERHKILGPDLATTHFITARYGKIKLKGNEEWLTIDDLKSGKIPPTYVPGFCVEEIDASNIVLCYEGFENLCHLSGLKKLILRDCPFVDDWCLNRSYIFQDTLEYLDISGCQNVSERGICTLYVLKKLKTLVIHDTPNIQNKELVCLLFARSTS